MTLFSVRLVKNIAEPSVYMNSYMDDVEQRFKGNAKFGITQRLKPMQTWKNETPTPLDIISRRADRMDLTIQMVGSSLGIKKWFWLSLGTKIRYAHMTSDFSPKTRIGFIGSVPGAGVFSHLGRPLPGIKARNWDKIINEQAAKRLNVGLKRSVKALQ